MVYVGSNNGMFHSFNAETGQQMLKRQGAVAYVPRAVYPDLSSSPVPGIDGHRYFIDGGPTAANVY